MSDSKKPIYVTRPALPPLQEFLPYLERIWASKVLTNEGPFHHELEAALCEYLGVKHISLFTNGTIALITALQSLKIRGEVITTPFSFVATSHSLVWNGIQPVFVDIDPVTLNMDPAKIEAAITPKTSAIMPVHCYGRPCDVQAIQAIAERHGLKVIYDAAHAFGVEGEDGSSVLNHGDLSIMSFHATKVFNTFEGGAIVSHSPQAKHRIDELKNFGIIDEVTVDIAGINGKMSEFNAAFGMLQLKHVDQAIAARREIDSRYREALKDTVGLQCMGAPELPGWNCAYFPLLVQPAYPLSRDEVYERLKTRNIFARRYFYPLISTFPTYSGLPSSQPENLPVATELAAQIICLPIYPDLSAEDQGEICDFLTSHGASAVGQGA
jgi:dTDP-4-amino-4,6-dideoxygalactose transaminase